MTKHRFVPIVLLGLASLASAADVRSTVDWKAFLARHDLVWNRLPSKWEEASFTGNGLLGATIYAGDDANTVRWHIGRSDVVFKSERIPVGELVLKPVGAIQSFDMRQDLWNAEVTGTIKTDAGQIRFRSFTHADQLVQVIEITPSAGEAKCAWDWKPGLAAAPRKVFRKEPLTDADKNPAPVRKTEGAIQVSLQPLQEGEHATAWTEIPGANGSRVVLLGVGYARTNGKAEPDAIAAVKKAKDAGPDSLGSSHRDWWHKFYPQSFVSVPDTRLESFYWINLYKFASATRADRPAIDLMGPWFRSTPWPKIWWNLNLQLTYWPVLTSNHLDLGESLCRMLDDGANNLAENAREFSADSAAVARTTSYDCAGKVGDEICNLPWTVHNYYLQYRYSMDEAMLRDRIYPLLKRSMNFYIHLLKEGDDGKLHITRGLSPEYPNQPKPNPDCNIDLALLRWGLQTLIDTSAKFNLNDPQAAQWKQTLEKLTPYPTDERGLKVSAGVSFDQSHRHYSHLLMVYPLYTMNAEQPENVPLIRKTMDNWLGMPTALRGYSFTGAASMYAMFGEGDKAIEYLNKLLDNAMKSGHVQPNTMYTEAGPVIETPFSGVASLNDMLLSSWGDRIRVFPGVPKAWADVSFDRLRAEGAFLVSAVRKGGKTQFVRIESLAGQPCRVKTDLADPVADGGAQPKKVADGVYEVPLKKGESIVLYSRDARPASLDIGPVEPQNDKLNYYGAH